MLFHSKKDFLLYIFFIILAALFWFIQSVNQNSEAERCVHDTITVQSDQQPLNH